MTYYFNSSDQQKGDQAYNDGNFEQALLHYKNGYRKLNNVAAQRNFTADKFFNDALTFVLSEIIIAITDAVVSSIEDSFDYTAIKNAWQEIPGFLNEMENLCTENNFYTERESTPEQIERVYKALAVASEAISDALVDLINEQEELSSGESHFKTAIYWLAKSISYKKQGKLPIDVSVHLGYLNLLEQDYKSTKDKGYLTKITEYLQNNLLDVVELSTMQQLEILSYELLVAVEFNEERAAQLAAQCKEIISVSEEIDEDSALLEDINQLIGRQSKSHAPAPVIEWNSRIIEMEEVDAFFPVKERSNSDFGSEETSKDEVQLMEWSEVPLQIDVVQVPTHPPAWSLLETPKIRSQNTFNMGFFGGQQKTSPSLMKDYHGAFIQAMQEVGNKYKDSGFLANLLSLIGDFYFKNISTFKMTPVIALELYENVLLINRHHGVAINRIDNIYRTNKAMIDSSRHYTSTLKSPNKSLLPIEVFEKTIEETSIQIETLFSTNSKKSGVVIDNLFRFVISTLQKERIAGSKSEVIAQELLANYEKILQSVVANNQILS